LSIRRSCSWKRITIAGGSGSQAGGATLVSVASSTISGNHFGAYTQHPGAKLVVASSMLARNSGLALV